MITDTIQDIRFRCRAMGMVGAATDDEARKWHAAAVLNPERIAMAAGAFSLLLDMLPTPEDAARTPVEVVKRNAVPVVPESLIVRDGNGDALGRWHGAKYIGLCPCESGVDFADCHGADSLASPVGNAHGGA